MKKRYLIPQTIVVKIQQPLLQAVSPGKYDEVTPPAIRMPGTRRKTGKQEFRSYRSSGVTGVQEFRSYRSSDKITIPGQGFSLFSFNPSADFVPHFAFLMQEMIRDYRKLRIFVTLPFSPMTSLKRMII